LLFFLKIKKIFFRIKKIRFIYLPEFLSWQTHSIVETDENRVSNERDNGIVLVLRTWSDVFIIDSCVKSNDDGHEWDLINDVVGIVVSIIDKEFDRSS